MGMARKLATVLILWALLAGISIAEKPETRFLYVIDQEYEKQIEKSRKRLVKFVDEAEIPGVAVALYKGDRIIWSEVWGYADLELAVPVNRTTRFRIASISKAITSVALGKLYEEGKLEWNDTIQKYVPYYPEKRWPMTIRQVAGHIGGVRTYRGNEYYQRDHYNDFNSALSIIANDTLEYEPGTKYLYSSYGTNLLGATIEGASGQEYLSYLEGEIFTPLGLGTIVADHVDSLISNRASPYVKALDGTILNAPYVDNSHKWAGGGLIASAEDIVSFGAAVMNAEILKPKTVEFLWEEQSLEDGKLTGYGTGWSIWKKKDEKWVGHGGGPVGGAAMLFINPEKEIVYAMLCNLQGAPVFDKNSRIILEPFLK